MGRLYVSFQRTAQAERSETQPASYGASPVAAAPPHLAADVLVPVHEDEALWLGLEPVEAGAPVALRVEVTAPEQLDAVTGQPPAGDMRRAPQNYLVCPPQRAMDGVQHGPHRARQFVRRARSEAFQEVTSLRLTTIPGQSRKPLPGAAAPRPLRAPLDARSRSSDGASIGVPQTIAPDPYQPAEWKLTDAASATVLLVDPGTWSDLTGRPAPPPRTDDDRYRGWRLP
ncbi:MAG TPA: hypothetical protein VHK06_07950 [Candidatus Limnocylindria bacterium]|nr:hypothetical protein [Candidatus Limnocylindria bacterium]